MYLFEDDGGILPVHTTGALFAGRDLTPAHLGFDVMLGNGIGATPRSDNNTAKSLTLALHSQISADLRLGVNYYHDRLTPGTARIYGAPVDTVLPAGDTLTAPVLEQLLGAYATYLSPTIELIAEYQRIAHKAAAGGASTANDAGYAYAGYRIGKLVPYARYDALLFDTADPYYVADDSHRGIVGARYDFAATTQLKIEYHRHSSNRHGSANEFHLQIAVGF
jgi:predicted porin